jgi:hypothetical protein
VPGGVLTGSSAHDLTDSAGILHGRRGPSTRVLDPGATPGTTVVGVSRTGFAGISRRIVEVTPDEVLEAFPAD